MRLVMTLKVRDEDDVLEDNLRFHRALGVDHFVVTDNGSTDGTPAILDRWQRAGLLHVTRDESSDLRTHGARWYTQMGRFAATELEADWVFHNDADEFWIPAEGTLKDALASIDERWGCVVCPRSEFPGRPDGPGGWADRLTVREARASLQPKVMHRGDPDVVVLHRGGHEVASAPGGDPWKALRPPGRAVHRAVRKADDGEPVDQRLVWAPQWPVRILHFPLRSFEQYRRRAEISALVGGFRDSGRFKRLRKHVEAGTLEQLHAELVLDDEAVASGIKSGELVLDQRVADLLPRCPGLEAAAEPGGVRVEGAPEAIAAERDAIRADALRLMARTQRFTMVQLERLRERQDGLRAENDRLQAELAQRPERRGLRRRS